MSDIAALAPPLVAAFACYFLVRGVYRFLQREEGDEIDAGAGRPAAPPADTAAGQLPADIAVVPVPPDRDLADPDPADPA